MGALLPILMRVIPLLAGVGETGGLAALARSGIAASGEGGVAGTLARLAGGLGAGGRGGGGRGFTGLERGPDGKFLPRGMGGGSGPSGSPLPESREIAETGIRRRIRIGTPINPDEPTVDRSIIQEAMTRFNNGKGGGYAVQSPVGAPTPPAAGSQSTATANQGRGSVNPNAAQQVQTGAFGPLGNPAGQAAQAQTTTLLNKMAGGLNSAFGALGKFAGTTIKTTLWMYAQSKALEKFANLIVESNRGLSVWNGAIANSFAQLDAAQQQRDLETANATAGTATTLNQSFSDLLDETQEVRELVANGLNLVGTGAVALARLSNAATKILGIIKIVESIENTIKKWLGIKDPPPADDQIDAMMREGIGAGQGGRRPRNAAPVPPPKQPLAPMPGGLR